MTEPTDTAELKVFYIGLYATATVIATDEDAARAAWENDEEFDVEIDNEGGPRWIEAADIPLEEAQASLAAWDAKENDAVTLGAIQLLLSGGMWDSDTLEAIANIVRSSGRPIDDYDPSADPTRSSPDQAP
jgi:hypothetical protein